MVQSWFLAPIILLGLIIADVCLTYLNTRDLARRYGLPLAAALEVNNTIRNSWLKYGLEKGETRVLISFILPYILILGLATAIWLVFPVAFGFIIGFYAYVVSRHVTMRRNLDSCHPCPQCRTIHRTSPFLPEEPAES